MYNELRTVSWCKQLNSWVERVAEWLSHSAVKQEVPGSNPAAAESVGQWWIVNIYLYEFILRLVCVCIRCFGLF